jgi:hypothetical protein
MAEQIIITVLKAIKIVDMNHPPLSPLPSREGRLYYLPSPLRERVRVRV